MAVVNALSFDVEDYFQVTTFEGIVPREDWPGLPSRVEANTRTVLQILAEHELKATFFTLGWIAKRYPQRVREIAEQGHELGSHGYDHALLYGMTPQQFREDLHKAVGLVEDACGRKVLGYRAPTFSITRQTLWAIDCLQEEGLRYDSSIFPVHHDRYGLPDAPRAPYEIATDFWEFPLTTCRILGFNIPASGGGYLRLFPYWFIHWSLQRMNHDGDPGILYLHPWEIDPNQPKINAGFLRNLRHRQGLGTAERKLRRLLQDLRWAPVKEVLNINS